MHSRNSTRNAPMALFMLAALIGFGTAVQAEPIIEIKVEDTAIWPGDQQAVISVSLSNLTDSVAGFRLTLGLDRDDIMAFRTSAVAVTDTTYYICNEYSSTGSCVSSSVVPADSVTYGCWAYDRYTTAPSTAALGQIDTIGTLIGGWEALEAVSPAGDGTDLVITAAVSAMPPYTTGISFPQDGETPLLKIIADIKDYPDTLSDLATTIHVQAEGLGDCYFLDQDVLYIATVTDTVYDTSWYSCLQTDPVGGGCIHWLEVTGPPADSFTVDTVTSLRIDTTALSLQDGVVTILDALCGDVNDDHEGPDIGDLTYLIRYLFISGPVPPYEPAADVDGVPGIDIGDVTFLISYLFISGPDPACL